MRTILILCIALILSACGGGGGGTAGTTLFSGTAMDGYLYKATVFLDLNENGTFDAGEPTATTSETGSFTLSATQEQINTYKVVVVAVAGTTIDQDSPNTTVTTGFTMMSPAGNHEVVSPLTTQVVAKMSAGLTLAAAKNAVQEDLGLTSIDVMKNYVAAKATDTNYAKAHNVAASIAEVLKSIEADSSSSTKLGDKLASLSSKVTSQVVPNVEVIKSASSVLSAIQVANIPKTPQSITASSVLATLKDGASTVLSAVITYTDKTTQNISALADWVVTKVSGDASGTVTKTSDGTSIKVANSGFLDIVASYLGKASDAFRIEITCDSGSPSINPFTSCAPAINTSSVALSGVAIDGNLYKATVFLDLNGDGLLTTGEPTTTTNDAGSFTLSATQEQIDKYKVVVLAVAGTTIDQDNPNTTIASGFTLMAPAGNTSVVSPFTTQVVAKMEAGATLENAKIAVQTELGLTSVDVMKNYVALKSTDANYAKAHNVAASIAEVLKTIDADSTSSTKLADKLTSLTAKVTTQIKPNIENIKSASSTTNALQVAAIPQSIKISTESNSFASGNSTLLSALATLSDKTTKTITSAIEWVVSTVSGSSTASVVTSSDGTKFTSTGPGVFSLVGKYLGLTDSTTVTVTNPVEQSITASSVLTSLVNGASTALNAVVTFSDKTTKNLSLAVEWVVTNVSGSGSATVSNSSSASTLTPTNTGVVQVIAKYLGFTSSAFQITITCDAGSSSANPFSSCVGSSVVPTQNTTNTNSNQQFGNTTLGTAKFSE